MAMLHFHEVSLYSLAWPPACYAPVWALHDTIAGMCHQRHSKGLPNNKYSVDICLLNKWKLSKYSTHFSAKELDLRILSVQFKFLPANNTARNKASSPAPRIISMLFSVWLGLCILCHFIKFWSFLPYTWTILVEILEITHGRHWRNETLCFWLLKKMVMEQVGGVIWQEVKFGKNSQNRQQVDSYKAQPRSGSHFSVINTIFRCFKSILLLLWIQR